MKTAPSCATSRMRICCSLMPSCLTPFVRDSSALSTMTLTFDFCSPARVANLLRALLNCTHVCNCQAGGRPGALDMMRWQRCRPHVIVAKCVQTKRCSSAALHHAAMRASQSLARERGVNVAHTADIRMTDVPASGQQAESH